VLHPDADGGAAPARLVAALEGRSLVVQTTPSAHEALAAACLARRRGLAPVVVLDRIVPAPRFREALDRFAPSALLWTHDPAANPPLGAFVEPKPPAAPPPESATPETATPEIASRPQPRPTDPPALRLTGDPGREPTSADILDRDELEALLRPNE